MILDWGWFDKYVLVNVVDEEGRRVIDSATPGCRKTVMERMYFAGAMTFSSKSLLYPFLSVLPDILLSLQADTMCLTTTMFTKEKNL